jgi:hypothetical protein
MQVGCGVGNSALPLVASNPTAKVFSCDYSPNAVAILKQAEGFQPERMHAFVADITQDDLTDNVPAGSVDVITCIFALSANSLESLHQVISHRCLKICSGIEQLRMLLGLARYHLRGAHDTWATSSLWPLRVHLSRLCTSLEHCYTFREFTPTIAGQSRLFIGDASQHLAAFAPKRAALHASPSSFDVSKRFLK